MRSSEAAPQPGKKAQKGICFCFLNSHNFVSVQALNILLQYGGGPRPQGSLQIQLGLSGKGKVSLRAHIQSLPLKQTNKKIQKNKAIQYLPTYKKNLIVCPMIMFNPSISAGTSENQNNTSRDNFSFSHLPYYFWTIVFSVSPKFQVDVLQCKLRFGPPRTIRLACLSKTDAK